MYRIASIILMCLLAVPITASLNDDPSDGPQSLVASIHRVLSAGKAIGPAVEQALQLFPDRSSEVVATAIVVSPGSISDIVEAALVNGVPPEVVARHCRSALTLAEIEQIVTSAMLARARPEAILGTCITAVPEQEIARILASALTSADSSMYASILESAYDAADVLDLDAQFLVNEGVLLSGVEVEDVDFVVVDDVLIEGFEEPEAAAELDFEERAASGS